MLTLIFDPKNLCDLMPEHEHMRINITLLQAYRRVFLDLQHCLTIYV